jgi:hypothetical protein
MRSIHSRFLFLTGALLVAGTAVAQSVPNAGLQLAEIVTVPAWTTSGSTQANYDLGAFNPVTRILYVADRVNHSVDAIDARTNTLVGVMPVPGNPSLNGVLVAPDLQQLVVTDGKNSVFVWDLRLPGSGPTQYVIPNITSGTDALDYDPLNQTVYLINGTAPYFITGISLAFGIVSSQLALPGSPELLRFNPADGMIYQVITDGDNQNKGAGVVVYDPVANAITTHYLTPNCVPHGIEIDSIANVALLGCGTNQGQVMLNLKDGTILKQFSDVTGSDLLAWNPSTRRFYTGSASNVATTSSCSADSTKAVPIIGVIDAQGTSGGTPVPRLDGVTCMGRNGKTLGVDPFDNLLYVAIRQYPVDPANAASGQTGVMVFWDPAPSVQSLMPSTAAVLKSLSGSAVQGTVQMQMVGRRMHLGVAPTGVTGASALVVITTTIGNETVPCAVDNSSKKAVCSGYILGDPMVGGSVTVAVDGVPAARGTIALPSGS